MKKRRKKIIWRKADWDFEMPPRKSKYYPSVRFMMERVVKKERELRENIRLAEGKIKKLNRKLDKKLVYWLNYYRKEERIYEDVSNGKGKFKDQSKRKRNFYIQLIDSNLKKKGYTSIMDQYEGCKRRESPELCGLENQIVSSRKILELLRKIKRTSTWQEFVAKWAFHSDYWDLNDRYTGPPDREYVPRCKPWKVRKFPKTLLKDADVSNCIENLKKQNTYRDKVFTCPVDQYY